MTICLIIRGRSKTGKTYASKSIESQLKIKCIHFDIILDLIGECSRLFFEKKESKDLICSPTIFESDSEKENFKNETFEFIQRHILFFKTFYDKAVKNTLSRAQIRQSGLNYDMHLGNFIRPGITGKLLEKYIQEYFFLVIKYFIKKSELVVLEGVYFLNEFYLNAVKKFYDKVLILDCLCVPAIGIEKYFFENKR